MNIIKIPEILLPKDGIDYQKWASIACDQFTSETDYWNDLEVFTKDAYSAYHITYPEIYLGKDEDARIRRINDTMKKYLSDGIFDTVKDSFILVERTTRYSAVPRFGLIISVDLEAYDFKPFNKSYIKATEGTIVERLPVRVKIRENALLELPHILLLIDDAQKSVIEPIAADRQKLVKLYDFELNKGGGHIKGYKVTDAKGIADKIYALADKDVLTAKYGAYDNNFLFAVGDGNHSLAAAKAFWEQLKPALTAEERSNHPARYALVELMNLYDGALKFEPIHRVVFNAEDGFIGGLVKLNPFGAKKIKAFSAEKEYYINVGADAAVAIKDIQTYIEEYIKNNPKTIVDYIHGEEHLKDVVSKRGGIGIVMPSITKAELFPFVVKNGVLPKKAFSMGEAEEKRYYLEAKPIR
ncbi:MAG: DUF1015 domain-containing protein [Clostridiales bacterium]|jgi:uncharacterized protein (DUF1015 family)|nr:DUF1015 domain-containing protein [Clostridiales bacterium]